MYNMYNWACFWHASTSIQGRIFVSARIRGGSGSFVSFWIMWDVFAYPRGYAYPRLKTIVVDTVMTSRVHWRAFMVRSQIENVMLSVAVYELSSLISSFKIYDLHWTEWEFSFLWDKHETTNSHTHSHARAGIYTKCRINCLPTDINAINFSLL
jgi:hypothetical protein